jgi:hypothetical protein
MPVADSYCSPWPSVAPRPYPLIALLTEMLRATPQLGARRACIGVDPRTMDATTLDDARTAMAVCAGCPALQACRRWAGEQRNKGRLEGVVAGQLRGEARALCRGKL